MRAISSLRAEEGFVHMLNLRSADVFVDLCLQREYLEDTRMRCLNHGQVARNSHRLMAYARWAHVPVISCVDAFPSTDDEMQPTVRRTQALQAVKSRGTVLPCHAVIDTDNCPGVSLDVLRAHQQVVFTKEHRDPFTNPKLDRLLTEMPAARFVVFGVPLESSVRMLVLGLIRRGRSVALVEDACGHWSEPDAQMTLRQLGVKGCGMLRAFDYVRNEALRLISRRRPSPRPTGTRSVA